MIDAFFVSIKIFVRLWHKMKWLLNSEFCNTHVDKGKIGI